MPGALSVQAEALLVVHMNPTKVNVLQLDGFIQATGVLTGGTGIVAKQIKGHKVAQRSLRMGAQVSYRS